MMLKINLYRYIFKQNKHSFTVSFVNDLKIEIDYIVDIDIC